MNQTLYSISTKQPNKKQKQNKQIMSRSNIFSESYCKQYLHLNRRFQCEMNIYFSILSLFKFIQISNYIF